MPGFLDLDLFPKGDLDGYLDHKKITKLTTIPFHPAVALASEMGIPVVESQGDSAQAQPFTEAAQKIIDKLC